MEQSAAALSQFTKIPLNKITPSPYQTRQVFDEGSLKELAQTLKDHGLMQPINVRVAGDHFELIAGERRCRAAKLLGWTEIEAKVETVEDTEAAERVMVENLQREDLSAIEQAQGYKRLASPPISLSQSRIAEMIGKDQSLVNKYITASKLCDNPGGMNRFIPLGLKHLLELCRLSSPDDQASLADEAVKKDLSVGQLRALVDQELGGSKKKKKASPKKAEVMPDPLGSEFWMKRMADTRLGGYGSWDVSYGLHQFLGAKGPVIEAWTFHVKREDPPQTDLKRWFQAMADSIGNTPQEEKAMYEPINLWLPRTEEEGKQLEKDQHKFRLPKDDQEEKALEALAEKGPEPLFAWIYGPDSYFTKRVHGHTWQDLGFNDPLQACHQIVDNIEQM